MSELSLIISVILYFHVVCLIINNSYSYAVNPCFSKLNTWHNAIFQGLYPCCVSAHFAKRPITLSGAYLFYSLVSLSYDEGHVIVSHIILYDYMYYIIIIMIFRSFIITNPDILIKKSLMHAQIHDNNSFPRVHLDHLLCFYVLKLLYTSSVEAMYSGQNTDFHTLCRLIGLF